MVQCEKGGMHMTHSANKNDRTPDVLPDWFIDNQVSEEPVERNLTDEEWKAERAKVLDLLGLIDEKEELK